MRPGAGMSGMTTPAQWAPRRVAALLSLCLLMSTVSVTYVMMVIALPALSAHYHTLQSAWVPTAFSLVGAVMAPLVGRLADGRGKRRVLLACIVVTAAGAAIVASAPDFAVVVFGCALLGLLNPCVFLGYTLILEVFPPRLRAMSASIAMGCLGAATMYAPFLAGWLIDDFGFAAVYWFVAGAALVCALSVGLTVPESQARQRISLDAAGAVLLAIGIAGVLLAISFAPQWGWTSGRVATCFVGGLVVLLVWVLWSQHREHPLIDLKLLTSRAVVMISLASGTAYAAGAVFIVILPFMAMTPTALHLGYGFGLDSMGFAWVQAPLGAGSFVAAFVIGLVAARFSARAAMVLGLLLCIVAAAAVARFHVSEGLVVALAGLMGLGSGCTQASIPNLIGTYIAPQVHATVGAVAGVVQSIIPAVAVVVTFTVLNAHVATRVDGRVLYSNAGISQAFLVAVVIGVIGVVAAWALPLARVRAADNRPDASAAGASPGARTDDRVVQAGR